MLAVTTDPSQAVARIGSTSMLTPFGQALYFSPLIWLVIFAPLALVSFLLVPHQPHGGLDGARACSSSSAAAMGLSLSTLVLVYTGNSIARAFFITAAAFGALSLYGYTTPRSLSAMGSFMIMGLFGLIIASVVNIFLHSTGFQFALCILSVMIFRRPHRLGYAGDQGNVLRRPTILRPRRRSRSMARCGSISISSISSSRCFSSPARATTEQQVLATKAEKPRFGGAFS